tara:strand:- start:235 stop:447 length:213 start_codon:yes stop_codon:yes gene_type:complete
MSEFYILITDSNDENYRCQSVSEALDVARYISRHYKDVVRVESNASYAVDDFMKCVAGDEYLSVRGGNHE